jgi:hypothetical protein
MQRLYNPIMTHNVTKIKINVCQEYPQKQVHCRPLFVPINQPLPNGVTSTIIYLIGKQGITITLLEMMMNYKELGNI